MSSRDLKIAQTTDVKTEDTPKTDSKKATQGDSQPENNELIAAEKRLTEQQSRLETISEIDGIRTEAADCRVRLDHLQLLLDSLKTSNPPLDAAGLESFSLEVAALHQSLDEVDALLKKAEATAGELTGGSQEPKESVETGFKTTFSKADEVKRIRYTLGKLDWYTKQKYRVNLPDQIKKIVAQGQTPTDEEILEAVTAEYNQAEYEAKAQDLKQKWDDRKDEFLDKLATLGLPLPSEYLIAFTKYGVSGSYGLPNKVKINFDYPKAMSLLETTFHEIIHLAIEDLVIANGISHWAKERLVDLIYGNFFPAGKRLQRDLEQAEQINSLFDQWFPDVKKIIAEVSKLGKGEQNL